MYSWFLLEEVNLGKIYGKFRFKIDEIFGEQFEIFSKKFDKKFNGKVLKILAKIVCNYL